MQDHFFQASAQSAELCAMSDVLKDWVFDPGSFVERLKKSGAEHPHIHVLQEAWQQPQEDERKILKLTTEDMWVREVLITNADKNLMFARTVVPRHTLTDELIHLGNRSLGSVLFKNREFQRSPFELAFLHSNVWARRSVFSLKEKSLLLTEIFLPDIETLGVVRDSGTE